MLKPPDRKNKRPEVVRFPFKLSRPQRVALHKLAEERDMNASAVLRDAIAQLTGVPDTLRDTARAEYSRRRDREVNGR
jgi:hypothetical protein